MAHSKKCFKCHQVKPLVEFYKHPAMADGRVGKCKACNKADVAAHRATNLTRIREYDRGRAKQQHRIANAKEQTRLWRAADSRRVAAHNAVARAIRSGRLVKKPCERCGSENSMAHHENYDKKLQVSWLCQPDHKQRHKEMVLLGIDP
jgi:hypothetical protein